MNTKIKNGHLNIRQFLASVSSCPRMGLSRLEQWRLIRIRSARLWTCQQQSVHYIYAEFSSHCLFVQLKWAEKIRLSTACYREGYQWKLHIMAWLILVVVNWLMAAARFGHANEWMSRVFMDIVEVGIHLCHHHQQQQQTVVDGSTRDNAAATGYYLRCYN